MASTTQLKLGGVLLMLTGLACLAAALARHQPLMLVPGALLIGIGRLFLRRGLQRTLPR